MIFRSVFGLALLIGFVGHWIGITAGAESEKRDLKKQFEANGRIYVQWNLPVVTSSKPQDDEFQTAKRLAEALGQTNAFHQSNNPISCFWFEIREPLSREKGGYVIWINSADATIISSSVDKARDAIKHLSSVLIKKEGATYLPSGVVLTDYDVINKR